MHTDPQLLEELVAEKDKAMSWLHRSLGYLQQARPFLKEEQYTNLVRWTNIAERNIYLVKMWSEAFFGYKVLTEGHKVPGLKQRVKRAVVTS